MTEPDWAAIRADYEGGRGTIVEIAARHGVTRDQLSRARRFGGWTPRHPVRCKPKPAALTARLMLVLDRLVLAMETNLANNKDVDAAQMRLLETMVKTLERLHAMEREDKSQGGGKGAVRKRSPAEEAALRQRLAERIAALARP